VEAVLLDEVAVGQAQRHVRHSAQPAVHLHGAVLQGTNTSEAGSGLAVYGRRRKA
jgi:hypothetical protein